MFSVFRKSSPTVLKPEDTVLVLLAFLDRNGLHRVAESELHRLVFQVASQLPVPMKFVRRPTTYSNELLGYLRRLERDRLVDELVYVHDGWVPKHLYQMTRVGRLRAGELEERIRTFGALPLEGVLESFAAAARAMHLLPQLGQ